MKKIAVFVITIVTVASVTFGPIEPVFAQTNTTTTNYDEGTIVTAIVNSVREILSATISLFNSKKELLSQTTNHPPPGVVANFDIVEYFPNLKSKLGFASNIKELRGLMSAASTSAGNYLDQIGPGTICSMISFDLDAAAHLPSDANIALVHTTSSTGQKILSTTPSDLFKQYERTVGDLNVSQVLQLTGGPAPYYQPVIIKAAEHPAPTNIPEAAKIIAQWTQATNHSYPIKWSFWNEPGHTLLGVARGEALDGSPLASPPAPESKAAFNTRRSFMWASSSVLITQMYQEYNKELRKTIDKNAQFGLASFIAADFNPVKLNNVGLTYFDAVMREFKKLPPAAPQIDFITFNSFNGKWPAILSGVRSAVGASSTLPPIIFTQYAPRTLKVDDNGDVIGGQATVPTMRIAGETLSEFSQILRATDVQHMCMSYWIGGRFGFISENNSSTGLPLVTTNRYETIKLFAKLPIVRTKLDLSTVPGVKGLAGKNNSKVGVLLWNETSATASVPVQLQNLPTSISSSSAKVYTLSGEPQRNGSASLQVGAFTGTIVLPPYAVAYIEASSTTITNDPVMRRQSISGAKFLRTDSFVDRKSIACTPETQLPGGLNCAENTGTYGFYDSVRSVAYLGKGKSTTKAKVVATYKNLPSILYANITLFTTNTSVTNPDIVKIEVNFPNCGNTTFTRSDQSSSSTGELQYKTFDFSSINSCANKLAVITTTLQSPVVGSQAEIYFSSEVGEAQALSLDNTEMQMRTNVPNVKEELDLSNLFR